MIPYCSQNNLRCDIYRIRANALRVPGMNLRLIIKFTSIRRRGGPVTPFTKWISIISFVAVSIVILTGCGDRVAPVPGEITATPGDGQITIAWAAENDATSYNIYWSTTPGVTPENGTKITGATSPFIHSGLANGTYYYVVTSVNKDGESAPSAEVSATLGQAAPTGVTATPANGQITIAWTVETTQFLIISTGLQLPG